MRKIFTIDVELTWDEDNEFTTCDGIESILEYSTIRDALLEASGCDHVKFIVRT
jgi:dihydroneopterin aldolase